MLKKLASYIGEFKKETILSPICIAVEVIMEVILPMLMAQVIDFGQLFSGYSQLLADTLESGSVLADQQGQIPPVEQHQVAVSLLAALLLWNLHVTHDTVRLQEPFAADGALALLCRQQGEPAIGIFQAVSLRRMFPQIRKQGRIHLQIVVYLFPSRRREAADGGADSDCGFILDKRNGVDWPVDTGHIPHHLRSAETLLFSFKDKDNIIFSL